MPTTVQVSEKSFQMLNKLKAEMRVRSHDEVIKMFIFEREGIPSFMFGSNRRLRPFSPNDEVDYLNYRYVIDEHFRGLKGTIYVK